MGLTSALVDLAHFKGRSASGPKVNGRTPYADLDSAQFKCRVSQPTTTEIRSDQIQFEQAQRDVTILCGVKFKDGTAFDWDKDWKVIVETGPYAGTYEMMGDAEPIRKKVQVIGWAIAARRYQGEHD